MKAKSSVRGASGQAKGQKESSFLKKRSKKLLSVLVHGGCEAGS
jgi:hypothetical protein